MRNYTDNIRCFMRGSGGLRWAKFFILSNESWSLNVRIILDVYTNPTSFEACYHHLVVACMPMQTTYCWKSWTLLTSPCHSRPCDHMDWSSLWQKQQQRWEWVWPEYKTKHDHEKGSWIVANPIFLWNTFSLIRFHLCKTWRQLWSPPHFLEPQSQSANLLPNQLSLGEKKNLNTLLYLKEKSHTINLDQNLQNLRSKFINGF